MALHHFIAHTSDELPEIAATELHLLTLDNEKWLWPLLQQYSDSRSTLAIADPFYVDAWREQQRPARLCLADWLYRRRYRAKALRRALASRGKDFQQLLLCFDARRQQALGDVFFNRSNLLALRQWLLQQNKSLLVIIIGDNQQAPVSTWQAETVACSHSLSSITQGQPYWQWRVSYWLADASSSERRLSFDDRAELIQSNNGETLLTSLENPLTESIYYSLGVFAETEQAPPDWHPVSDISAWQMTVEPASHDAIVLPYHPDQAFAGLAERVFAIRQQSGRHLRILIRERGEPMRHHDEKLLLQLGVTLVIPASLDASRVSSLVENTQGWLFTRPLLNSIEQAWRGKIAADIQGYLPLPDFIKHVRDLTQQAERLDVDVVLIEAQATPGLSTVELVKYFKHRREGDICTIVDRQVYFYLYACRSGDVDKALQHLFGVPSSSLLAEEVRWFSHADIYYACQNLQQLQQSAPNQWFDYSDQLRTAAILQTPSQAINYNHPEPQPAIPATLKRREKA